MVALGTV